MRGLLGGCVTLEVTERARIIARELLRPESCVHCIYSGYRLASFLWVITAAKQQDAAIPDAEGKAWLNDMHGAAIAAMMRGDKEALARLALELVPETEAAIAAMRARATPTDMAEQREFLDALLEKVRRP